MVPIMSKFPKFLKIKEKKTYIYPIQLSGQEISMITDKQENTSNSGGSDSRRDSDGAADIVGTQEQLFPLGKSFGSGEGRRSKTLAGSYFYRLGVTGHSSSVTNWGHVVRGQWAPPVFQFFFYKKWRNGHSFFRFSIWTLSSSFSPQSVKVGNN